VKAKTKNTREIGGEIEISITATIAEKLARI